MDYKKERLRVGMTQVEVARGVGVSLSAYRLWELGGGSPSSKNMAKLKKVFGIKE